MTTTTTSKANTFGAITMALQRGALVLPRHPELLRQLGNLEYETLDSGAMRIAVPERRGHDDLVMALSFAFAPVVSDAQVSVRPQATIFDYRTGRVVSGPSPEVDERAAMLLRRWAGAPPHGRPRGESLEQYAHKMARAMLYGPEPRRGRR